MAAEFKLYVERHYSSESGDVHDRATHAVVNGHEVRLREGDDVTIMVGEEGYGRLNATLNFRDLTAAVEALDEHDAYRDDVHPYATRR